MTGEALQQAMQTIRQELLATARRYFPSDSRAEDMVQDALLRLWEIKETLREPINSIANILVRNIAVDTLRREKPTVDIDGMEIGTPSNANDVHERYNKVMKIIDQMPQAQQTIIRLRLIDGMEYEKISKLTGIKEATIRQTISRGRMAIRLQYKKNNEN